MRAGLVALCIGPILTVINQWEALLGLQAFSAVKAGLSVAVPFAVSFLSGWLTCSALKQDPPVERLVDVSTCTDPVPVAEDVIHVLPRLHPNTVDIELLRNGIDQVKIIQDNAAKVNASSRERVGFIDDLISRFEGVRASVNDLSGSAVKMKDKFGQTNKQIDDVSGIVTGLADEIVTASQLATGALEVTHSLSSHFVELKTATDNIENLQIQTQLLSLNASVEATRHGDQGKGFAVIAAEIRQLSDRSRGDLEAIRGAYGKLLSTLDGVTGAVQDISDNLAKSSEFSADCKGLASSAVEDISQASSGVTAFAAAASQQLPNVLALIDDVKHIKSNTEAAVVGSEHNMRLCKDVISQLGIVGCGQDGTHQGGPQYPAIGRSAPRPKALAV